MTDASINDNKKKLGRPATGTGQLIGVRLAPTVLSDLDGWIANRPDPKPTRPEAIRSFIQRGLKPAAPSKEQSE